ncbi:hypothetical protein CDCA_CDCA02G0602 [Cyanidium caldarium]|uniref:O-methyltransferase n=1 Tax=Cyanidium caldarium TaxID=2771 RepID=A0AAV9IQQ8_CYACA|nr:hypothetical protein CDCA_CDCA02G0602 [Cyanidium caldarium]
MSSLLTFIKSTLLSRWQSRATSSGTEEGKQYEASLLVDPLAGQSPPWPLFTLSAYYGVGTPPPPQRALLDSLAYLLSACLGVAARLDIAGVLGRNGGGMSAVQIGEAVGCRDATSIARVLRTLENYGYFESYSPPTRGDAAAESALEARLWRNNAVSAVLRAEHPKSVRGMVIHQAVDVAPAAHLLYDSMTEAKRADLKPSEVDTEVGADFQDTPSAFERLHGHDAWSYFAEHPDRWDNFHVAMRNVDSVAVQALLDDIDWGRYLRIVDIGGANGTMCERIMERHAVRAVIFDLPSVIEHTRNYWNEKPERAEAVSGGRVSFAAGDFLRGVGLPPAAPGDVYLMRNIWHDWRTKECVKIGRSIRAAIGDTRNAQLMILESSCDMAPRGAPLEKGRTMTDEVMHVIFRSRERSKEEMAALMEQCGFRLVRVQTTRSLLVAFIGEPVYGKGGDRTAKKVGDS